MLKCWFCKVQQQLLHHFGRWPCTKPTICQLFQQSISKVSMSDLFVHLSLSGCSPGRMFIARQTLQHCVSLRTNSSVWEMCVYNMHHGC
jgi:hypothetical protein